MAAGHVHDFDAFYNASWGGTVACAYAVTGDLGAAEDLAQEAYTRLWPRWDRVCGYDDPGAWVRKVATRLAISRWRRARVARAFLARSAPLPPTPGPDETCVALVRALEKLPPAQRRAIVLHHLADCSVAEVARLEGCPTGTVKARLSRGRALLATHLDPDAPAPSGLENTHA